MSTNENKSAVKIDASAFNKHVGDSVKQGEVLGEFAGKAVTAPCDSIIEGTSFDAEDHALIVVMKPKPNQVSIIEGDPHQEK